MVTELIDDPMFQAGRRAFFGKTGLLLSGAAVALLAGRGSLAAKSGGDAVSDVRILTNALAAEREAVAAYRFAGASGLLAPSMHELALHFGSQHQQHADALVKAIVQLGGTPRPAAKKFEFPALTSEAEWLRFAAGLEQGAVSAYLGAVPAFASRDLAQAAASILGDEAMHWALLRHALGEPPAPAAFVS
jgi:rubrerythrin